MVVPINRSMITYINCSWNIYFTVADIHRNSMFDGKLHIQKIQCRPTGNKQVLVKPTLTRECEHKTRHVIPITIYVTECFLLSNGISLQNHNCLTKYTIIYYVFNLIGKC